MADKTNGSPRSGIVGAAIVPHAPQFLTLPETEDRAQVARVHAAMRELGDRFRALAPDLVIVISNAHCDDFVVRCVPAFAGAAILRCGDRCPKRADFEALTNTLNQTKTGFARDCTVLFYSMPFLGYASLHSEQKILILRQLLC